MAFRITPGLKSNVQQITAISSQFSSKMNISILIFYLNFLTSNAAVTSRHKRRMVKRHAKKDLENLTPTLSGFKILNDAKLIIQNRLLSKLFQNIFHQTNFIE